MPIASTPVLLLHGFRPGFRCWSRAVTRLASVGLSMPDRVADFVGTPA